MNENAAKPTIFIVIVIITALLHWQYHDAALHRFHALLMAVQAVEHYLLSLLIWIVVPLAVVFGGLEAWKMSKESFWRRW